MLKEKERNLSFGITVLLVVLFLTIGYSAFERSLLLDDIALDVRPVEDIRVTGTWQAGSTNSAKSNSVDYNVKSSLLNVDLPQETSTITYTVQVTNIGNVDMGILNITGLPENMEYELTNYTLKEKICSEERCSRGIKKEFQITIKYKSGGYDSSNTTYSIKLDYDFQRFWNVNYEEFNEEEIKDMPTEVLNGDTLILSFEEGTIENFSITMNGEEFQDYKFEKGTITIENVSGDITISKVISSSLLEEYGFAEKEEIYIVPKTGYYKLEVWGAQGGDANKALSGGKGGYSVGAAYLIRGQKLYINIGGQGSAVKEEHVVIPGGYNGGGDGYGYTDKTAASGGGATSIATVSGELSTLSKDPSKILIVAAGGGGATYEKGVSYAGGAGGGLSGIDGTSSPGSGATQTYGGIGTSSGTFGKGGNNEGNGPGGGGGYYGGAATGAWHAGGGGSSYIDGVITYGEVTAQTIAGNASMPNTDGTGNETGHVGNGSAKITFISEGNPPDYKVFPYTGGEQTYVVPTTGYYKLEVWGAQGGDAYRFSSGGHGGYSVGAAYLEKGQKLYINVGGHGNSIVTTDEAIPGGYNGGGNGHGYTDKTAASGGGATHIATASGELSTLSEKINEILIVAAGGGGAAYEDSVDVGGAGGGIEGIKGSGGTGGTQTFGGIGIASGTFGRGGDHPINGTGGGGGYFGGASGNVWHGAGGGSSYIGGVITYGEVTAKMIDGTSSMPNTEENANETGHIGNGYAKITFITEGTPPNYTKFLFTGKEETYKVEKTGYYKLETWGAQGGDYSNSIHGGKGAYAIGVAYLTKGQTLYVNVGGQGKSLMTTSEVVPGGYNGGGDAHGYTDKTVGSGGGATHIAIVPGKLSTLSEKVSQILIVAAGGGGAGYQNSSYKGIGGGGGGVLGLNGSNSSEIGGTQNIGGLGAVRGSFGQGGSNEGNGTGGGGGYYGGGSGGVYLGGGGGSSYIGGVNTYKEITAKMVDGNSSVPNPSGGNEIGHTGNGYAQITFISEGELPKYTDFIYTGEEQTYVVPTSGYYKLEVWGAQGSDYSSSLLGGRGGYSVGAVYLNAGEKLYINVGGQGKLITKINEVCLGGYNGGGNAHGYIDKSVGSGGGATHIATTSGQLSTLSEKISNVLIVAGGGGGAGYEVYKDGTLTRAAGGAGGGLSGLDGSGSSKSGATQTAGGGSGTLVGSFGQGGSNSGNGTGGGGGYYGGGAGSLRYGGGGGSGYIGGVTDYGDITAQTIAGNASMPTPSEGNETGHAGYGYAKITFIG